jgi:hypothetical protein
MTVPDGDDLPQYDPRSALKKISITFRNEKPGQTAGLLEDNTLLVARRYFADDIFATWPSYGLKASLARSA